MSAFKGVSYTAARISFQCRERKKRQNLQDTSKMLDDFSSVMAWQTKQAALAGLATSGLYTWGIFTPPAFLVTTLGTAFFTKFIVAPFLHRQFPTRYENEMENLKIYQLAKTKTGGEENKRNNT